MMNESDKFACGIRFLMAIDPQLVDNFFAKVRKTIDPCDCRCQLVTEEVGQRSDEEWIS